MRENSSLNQPCNSYIFSPFSSVIKSQLKKKVFNKSFLSVIHFARSAPLQADLVDDEQQHLLDDDLLFERRFLAEYAPLKRAGFPSEGILLGKRGYPSEGILLGKRRYPSEGILLGRRGYPSEGILLGKRNFRF